MHYDYALGAVFAQVQPDRTEKPVAFASRTLIENEQKYSTVEKEALACVWAAEKMENLPAGDANLLSILTTRH